MNRIKQLRESLGMTQQDLSNVLNVKGAAISKYENEKIPITADAIQKLAKFFNVSTDYLLGKTDDINASTISNPNDKEPLSGTEYKILSIFRKYQKEGFSKSIYNEVSACIPELSNMTSLSIEEEKLLKIFNSLSEENRDILIGKASELLKEQFDIKMLDSYFSLDRDTRLNMQNFFMNYIEESRKHPEKKRNSEELVKELIEQEQKLSYHDSFTVDDLEEEYKKSRLDAAKKKEPSASNITDEEEINSKNKTEA